MFRHAALLIAMLLMALTNASAVHAQELAGAVGLECSGYVHSDGDADQTQGDADRAAPHHHGGCQGGVSLLPARPAQHLLVAASGARLTFAEANALGRWSPGPALRPPIA